MLYLRPGSADGQNRKQKIRRSESSLRCAAAARRMFLPLYGAVNKKKQKKCHAAARSVHISMSSICAFAASVPQSLRFRTACMESHIKTLYTFRLTASSHTFRLQQPLTSSDYSSVSHLTTIAASHTFRLQQPLTPSDLQHPLTPSYSRHPLTPSDFSNLSHLHIQQLLTLSDFSNLSHLKTTAASHTFRLQQSLTP